MPDLGRPAPKSSRRASGRRSASSPSRRSARSSASAWACSSRSYSARKGLGRGDFFFAHRGGVADDVAQPVGVAIWKVGGNLHPFLPLCPDSSGFALEFSATSRSSSSGSCSQPPSSCWNRSDGFTLEVQHFREGLGWGSEVKAFAGSVVVGGKHLAEAAGLEGSQVGLARDEDS